MNQTLQFINIHRKEIIYQSGIILVLFVFFSYSQDELEQVTISDLFSPYKIAFFLNYFLASMVINYVLLPVLYYKSRTILFFLSIVALIGLVILIDEFVLEKIFFPDTRGSYFPGFFYTFLETLPIIIIIVGFKFAWDSNKKQRELDSLKDLMRESEMQFLKSQINPHFLFNNLNNLYSYAMEQSPKTPKIILELSSVLRYMLYDCQEDEVPLSKEVEHLKNYTSLYEMQIETRGKVQFSEDIKSLDFRIPPLVMVVFIENAFKHSGGSQSSNIVIDIKVDVSEEGILTFSCLNNYAAQYNLSGTASGIGLENVKKRLHLLYPDSHELQIDNDGTDYHVKLTMQLKPAA